MTALAVEHDTKSFFAYVRKFYLFVAMTLTSPCSLNCIHALVLICWVCGLSVFSFLEVGTMPLIIPYSLIIKKAKDSLIS